MPSLLRIDVSPRGDFSVSRRLGAQFEVEYKAAHPGSTVVTRDLATTDIPFVSLPWISGAYTPEEAHNDEQRAALKLGNEFIAEIMAADHILLTTPMYNFAVPAALKAWLDHVIRAGKTFKVTPEGAYVGLVQGKKTTVIIASAGSYAPGSPIESINFEKPYLKFILSFLGITDVTFIDAGGARAVATGQTTIEDFIAPLAEEVKAAAAAI